MTWDLRRIIRIAPITTTKAQQIGPFCRLHKDHSEDRAAMDPILIQGSVAHDGKDKMSK